MNNKERVAVIILNWNGWRDTLECVSSIRDHSYSNIEMRITVVDNGSTDESLDKLKDKFGFELISLKTNVGFAAGTNVGIEDALNRSCDYVVLLNNDTVVGPNFLVPLVETFNNRPSVGIVSPKIYYSEPSNRIWFAGGKFRQPRIIGEMIGIDQLDSGQFDHERAIDFAVGCCMMVKKSVFQDIGNLDEKFFFYHEDVDFSIRASNAGYKVWYQPASYIFHKVSHSTSHDSALRTFLEAESRVVFFSKHVEGLSWVGVIFLELIRAGRYIFQWISSNEKEISLNYLQGLFSGTKRALNKHDEL